MEKWLRVRDVAAILNITSKTLHKLIRKGDIPAKKIGHHWRIPESKLKEYLES